MKSCRFLLISVLSFFALNAYAVDTSTPDSNSTSDSSAVTPVTPAPSIISATPTTNINGNYNCQGYDPYAKSTFNSTVSVQKNGEVYTFQWLSNGYPYNLGTGVLGSSAKNTISVVFWDPKKPDYFGTEVFEIKGDGSLNAIWALQSQNKLGNENCTKAKA